MTSSSGDPEFSESGEYVLIHAIPELNETTCGTSLLFIVNLKTKHVSKLTGNYFGIGKWVGNSIAISTGSDEEIESVKIINPTNNKSRSLYVCGLVVAGDPGGKFILIQANPEKIKEPIPWKKAEE